jgi:hypothetical protein
MKGSCNLLTVTNSGKEIKEGRNGKSRIEEDEKNIYDNNDDIAWFFDEEAVPVPSRSSKPVEQISKEKSIPAMNDFTLIRNLYHSLQDSLVSSYNSLQNSSKIMVILVYRVVYYLWKHFVPLSDLLSLNLFSNNETGDTFFIKTLIQVLGSGRKPSSKYSTQNGSFYDVNVMKSYKQFISKDQTNSDDIFQFLTQCVGGNDQDIDNLESDYCEGFLKITIGEQLQCKYVKGISTNHSFIAANTLMINGYYQQISCTFYYLYSVQSQVSYFSLKNKHKPVFQYHNIFPESSPPSSASPFHSISCSRIFAYHCTHDSELISSSSISLSSSARTTVLSSVSEVIVFSKRKELFLQKIKSHFLSLSIEIVICYDIIMNDSEIHQQMIDLCQELHILFLFISNLSDYEKCGKFLPNLIFYDTFLSITKEDIFEQEVAVSLFSPLCDLSFSSASSWSHSSAGIEIGEYNRLVNNSFQFTESNYTEDTAPILYGNQDYDVIILLQLVDGPTSFESVSASPLANHPYQSIFFQHEIYSSPCMISIVFTAATLTYLQALFYSFFRLLNKVRIIIENHGEIMIGGGLVECLQLLLIEEKCEELSQLSLNNNTAIMQNQPQDTASEGQEDYSLIISFLHQYASLLEEYGYNIMSNGGIPFIKQQERTSQSQTLLKRLFLKKDCKDVFSTELVQFLQDPVISQRLLPITMDLEGGSSEGLENSLVYDIPQVKMIAFHNAIELVSFLLSDNVLRSEENEF